MSGKIDQFEKKEVIQAILIADNNVEKFLPLSDANSMSLLPLVNVPILDYTLEALNRSGIEEVFIYASRHLHNVREHIRLGISSFKSWSINMQVHVIGGEGCRCFGDAMRDLDAKALIRGNFILLGTDTVTNVNLRPIIEEHKKILNYDKGAAATLIFKEATTQLRTGNEVMIALDVQNKRLHHHQRLRLSKKETHFDVPLEVFINNSQVVLLHNLIDPQIAIGSPAMLSLFSDNFDFETRDDFVRGILINEEILDSRIYVSLLPREQYARKVNNWLSYQIVSEDIINRWAYPLVPDMGIHCLKQQYIFLKNNIYKSPTANVAKVALRENTVVQSGSTIETGSSVSCSVIGADCKIGKNCRLLYAFLMENVIVADNCWLEFCIIGAGAVIGANSRILEGTVVDANSVVPAESNTTRLTITSSEEYSYDTVTKLSDKAYIIDDTLKNRIDALDSDIEDDDFEEVFITHPKMSKYPLACEESDYASSSDDEDDTRQGSPIPDDTNIFLSEVMDSLARCFQEKSNPDFVILEINSSRYAYNMSLKEVNFYVVKAIFSLESIKEPLNDNVLVAVNSVLKHLGPVMSNYIKTEDAMLECLKALADICRENQFVREKVSQIVHYLYDKDFVTEDAIMLWYEELDVDDDEQLKQSLRTLIEWLNQSTDEEDDDSD